jgi:hypothetical protein
MFNAAKSFAQIGSTSNNPYIMNLNDGAGYGEFQFHYPDTVMYVKLVGLQNKQNFYFNIDTTSSLAIKRITLKKIDNLANNIYDSEVASLNYNLSLNNIYFTGIDTAVLLIKKDGYSNACNFCDTANLKLGISLIQQILPDCSSDPRYCDNLVRNGNLEQFAPQFEQNSNNAPNDGMFIMPEWGFLRVDEGYTCGWNYEWYDQGPGSNPQFMQVSPTYVNSWFDEPTTFTTCTLNIPINTLSQCNYLLGNGLTALSCNIQPQIYNYFFPSALGYTNEGYIRSNLLNPSRMMRGQIDPPLQQNKKYYLEVNIGAPNSGTFGGLIDIDVSSSINYNQASYQGGLPAADVELQLNGFDYDQNNLWRKFNTVFTANGNESRVYAGNLSHNAFAQFPSANPVGTYCYNTGNGTYFLDNFIVKEFFADAGNPTIACEGAPVKIGGNSCPFPNAVYNWQPAAYFVDNTLQNPTFILPLGSGLSNVTCTLTVTIPMADGTFATTDPSYVDITIIQGNSITLSGITSVVTGGYTTLYANGGSNYVWTGSDGTSFTGASINVGPLTQDVTYTVNALSNSGCSVTEIITVIVTPLPAACISDPNYPNTIIIPNGTNTAGLISLIPIGNIQTNPNNTQFQITNVNFALQGDLQIDNNALVIFYNCHFACYDGSQILNSSSDITFRVCTLEACNNVLWKGILNEGKLALSSCLLKDAVNAVLVAPQSINSISGSTFTNNYKGINIFGPCTFANNTNKFENPDPLFPHWLGWNLPRALCGIQISDATFIQIDGPPTSSQLFTEFKNINCGILCLNTDLLVSNAYFENIQDQFADANHINGTAIYTEGTSAHRLKVLPLNGVNQATTFLNCATGIYHEGYNTRLDYLGMQNVTRGIVGEQLAFCTNRMEYNTINASIYGIEMNLIDDVDLFVINHNTITMNSTIARGIAVSAFSNSSSAGSNIKIQGNTIDITRGSVGIEVNSINHPKVNINVISHGLVSTSGFATTWHGVKATNCFRADISCNNLTVGAGLIPGNSGADIYVAQSQNTLVACNTTNGESPTGIFLSSGNNGSAIQTNEIGSHHIGLYLDNSCMIGKQPDGQLAAPHANKWNGSYSNTQFGGAAAVNTNIWTQGPNPTLLMSLIDDNHFKANPPSITQPFWPENYPDNTFNTNWFVPSSLQNLDPCTGGYCPAPFEDHWDDDKKSMSSINGSIALGLIQTTGYPEETKWMLKKGLIKTLTQNDSLLNTNDTMEVFYYSVDQENLKKLQFIADTVMAVKLHNQALIESMQANDSIMSDFGVALSNLMPLLEDSLMHDSILSVMDELRQQYSIIAAVNETYSNMLINQRNTAGQLGSNMNTSIVPVNFNEYLERKVNEIYYNSYGQGLDSLNNEDIAMLSYISHICPQAGGPSVYKARAIYQLVNDTVIYQDSVTCRNVGYFRESQELLMPELKEKTKINNFEVYPNPGNDRLKLKVTGNNDNGFVYVYNSMGALIDLLPILKETNFKELDISAWSEGFYIIKYQSPSYQSQVKFIKVK